MAGSLARFFRGSGNILHHECGSSLVRYQNGGYTHPGLEGEGGGLPSQLERSVSVQLIPGLHTEMQVNMYF